MITKQLEDILSPSNDAQFILVEGLPGIGKTLLLQEIAYNWAMGNVLKSSNWFFLFNYVTLLCKDNTDCRSFPAFLHGICKSYKSF